MKLLLMKENLAWQKVLLLTHRVSPLKWVTHFEMNKIVTFASIPGVPKKNATDFQNSSTSCFKLKI